MLTEQARWLLAAVGLSTALSGCPKQPVPPPLARAVASVDGEPIATADLRRELWRLHGKPEPHDQARLLIAQALLDQWIDQKVLARAAKKAGLTVSARELQAAWEGAQEGYRQEDFKAALYAQMVTPEHIKAQLLERLLTEKYLAQESQNTAAVTPDQIKVYYESNITRYRVPEMVRARQILVRTNEEARIVQDRLTHGEDFAKLAHEFSVSPEKERGGDLGFFQKGIMPEVFDKVCFALKPGEVSEVVVSEYGEHIFQVTERRPESQQTLHAVEQEIRDLLRRSQMEAGEGKLLLDLKQRAHVEKDVDALRAAADVDVGGSD